MDGQLAVGRAGSEDAAEGFDIVGRARVSGELVGEGVGLEGRLVEGSLVDEGQRERRLRGAGGAQAAKGKPSR